jgi:hypothetical protein
LGESRLPIIKLTYNGVSIPQFGTPKRPSFLNVEDEFRRFVREFGGVVLKDTLEKSPNFRNADFLFHNEQVVVELKRLVDDKSVSAEILKKISAKFRHWINLGMIGPVYGTTRVESRNLPQSCQTELAEIFVPSVRRRILKANDQIKSTILRLNLRQYKGLVLLVNDGNYAIGPDGVMYFLNRILRNNFSCINSIVYMTVNVFGTSSFTDKDVLVWMPASRPQLQAVSSEFLERLFRGWLAYYERLVGQHVDLIDGNKEAAVGEVSFNKLLRIQI